MGIFLFMDKETQIYFILGVYDKFVWNHIISKLVACNYKLTSIQLYIQVALILQPTSFTAYYLVSNNI